MVKADNAAKPLYETLKIGIFQIEPFPDGKLKFINEFGIKILGYNSSANEIIDNQFNKLFVSKEEFLKWYNGLSKNKFDDEFEVACLTKSGEEKVFGLNGTIVKNADNEILRIDGTIRDIHKSKENELEKEIVSNVNQILISNLDIRVVYQKVCNEIRRKINWDRVSITLLEQDGTAALNFLVTKIDKKSAVSKRLGLKNSYPFIGSLLEKVVRSGKAVITKDTSLNENETDKIFAKDGLMSRLSYPLISRSKIIGSVNFSSKSVNYYKNEHIRLLDKVVPFLAIAIENTKLYIRATKSEKEYKELFKTIDSPWF